MIDLFETVWGTKLRFYNHRGKIIAGPTANNVPYAALDINE